MRALTGAGAGGGCRLVRRGLPGGVVRQATVWQAVVWRPLILAFALVVSGWQALVLRAFAGGAPIGGRIRGGGRIRPSGRVRGFPTGRESGLD